MATTSYLALDVNGVSELRMAAWEFKNFPEIAAGDTLASSPAPVIAFTPASPALTIGTPTVSGTQVLATVSVTGGKTNARYSLSCRVQTASGRILINDAGALMLVGPS